MPELSKIDIALEQVDAFLSDNLQSIDHIPDSSLELLANEVRASRALLAQCRRALEAVCDIRISSEKSSELIYEAIAALNAAGVK